MEQTSGETMQRTARWLVAVMVPLIVFGGCAALLMAVTFPWTPSAESDRWSVAFAIAAFVGAAAGGPLVWWAQRETPDPAASDSGASSGHVSMRAKLGTNSQNYMAGRDLRIDNGGDHRSDG